MKVLIFILLLSVFLTPVTSRPCFMSEESSYFKGCLNCDDEQPWSCNMCDEGYRLIFDEGGFCRRCFSGTGKAADETPQSAATTCDAPCSTPCNVCGAQGKCLTCKPGYYMTARTNTCTLCEGGKGSDESTNIFFGEDTECSVDCPTGCNNCISTSECVSCKAGYYFNQETKLCSLCPEGKGRDADTTFLTASTTCETTCGEGCLRCGTNPNKCMACKAGYAFSAEMNTCTKCPAGTTAVASDISLGTSTKCNIPCDAKCSLCLGSSDFCLGCAAGHFFNAETNKCIQCESGKGRAADESPQAATTTCGVDCALPCVFCGATAATCLGCDAHNKFTLATHTCSTCPTGFTKAADTSIQTKDTACDITCNLGCKFCSGNANTCRGCFGGWSFSNDGNSCTSCDDNGQSPEATMPASSDTTCQSTCDPTCRTCGDSTDDCRSCDAGKRLDWTTKKCVDCPIGYTKAADTQSQVASTTCDIKCANGCAFCDSTNPNTCLGCFAGFSFDFDAKTCTSCDQGSGRAADSSPPTESKSCTSGCNLPCTICGGSADECVGCSNGHRLLIAYNKCIRCSGGSGRAFDTTAQSADTICNVECQLGCDSCTGAPGTCLTCDQGFYKNAAGACTRCPDGRGKPRDTDNLAGSNDVLTQCPLLCHSSCLNCKGEGADECLGCLGAYEELTQYGFGRCELCGGKKSAADPVGWTKRGFKDECSLDCHATCESCNGPGDDRCLACPTGYYLEAGKCIICNFGTGKPSDSNGASACISCDPSCLRCSGPGPNQCIQCNANYKLTEAGRCEKCESGFTKSADAQIVSTSSCDIPCNARCTACSGANLVDCLTCKDGFYRGDGEGCLKCPVGKGKRNNPDVPTPLGDPSSCDIVCHPSCGNCWGPDQFQCTNCKGGYFWSGDGSCSICPDGKGTSTGSTYLVGTDGVGESVCNPMTCHPSCRICSGADDDAECKLCARGYYMTSSGMCDPCPLGKGKERDEEITIGVEACDITCHSDCGTCYDDDDDECLSCRAGKFLSSGYSCEVCAAGFGKPDDESPLAAPTTSTAACTKTCHKSCSKCKGDTANDCLECNAGYYKSGATSCSLCPAGYGSVAGTTSVSGCTIPCHSSCSVCKNGSDSGCLTCKAGYFFTLQGTQGTCTFCPDNKGFATRTEEITTSDTSCTNCNANCLTCGEQDTQCLRCHAGKYLKGDNTCEYCGSGTGKAADSGIVTPSDSNSAQCQQCHPSCNICSGPAASNCLSCAQDYFWTGSTGMCEACAVKKHKGKDNSIKFGSNTADTCETTCENQCVKCQGTAANCLTCDAAYYLSALGTCSICGAGRGKAADTGSVTPGTEATKCQNCHRSCDKCSGPANNQCLHCAAGHYLSAQGVCTLCPSGRGSTVADFTPGSLWGTPASDVEDACPHTCDPTCSSCSAEDEASKCVGCAAGYYFNNDGRCAQCDLGFGKPVDTESPLPAASSSQACTRCHESCALCKGPNANDCLLCAAGHYLSAANTCSLCSGGFGKPADPTPVSTPSTETNGSDMCTTRCDPTCNTCSGTGSNQCLTCASGFFWAGGGTCTRCGDRTGKAAGSQLKTIPETSADCDKNCHESCLVCFDNVPATCVMCSAGYFYSAEHTCTMCPNRKGKLKDPNYPVTVTANVANPPECEYNCHPTCRTCTGPGATECLNCAAGFYLTATGVCTGCPANQGKPADNSIYTTAQPVTSCQACHKNCNRCKGPGPTDCLNCNDGLFLSAAGTCSPCPSGRGSAKAPTTVFNYPDPVSVGDEEVCPITCVYPCITCKDNTATGCLSCDAGHFLSAAGTCTTCRSGYGKAADSPGVSSITNGQDVCDKRCSGGCGLCSDTASTACLSCLATFYRSAANSCSSCGPARGGPGSPLNGPPTTEEAGCTDCHSSCPDCSGPAANECLDCRAGYFLSAEGTCEICPFGFGKYGRQGNPRSTTQGVDECNIPCSGNCRTCVGTNTYNCIGCRASHFYDDGECSVCPAGKGKATDTAETVPINDQTSDDCKITCHSSCKACGGPTENDCTSCAAGHWWSGEGNGVLGKCEACPKSRGKAADPFQYTPSRGSPDQCTTYCDLCEAGCLTCSDNPSECALCIDTKYLTAEKTCADCPENCLKCSDATKCDTCDADYELTPDGKSCLKCQVLNCETCTNDPFKCTKCADKFTLKSETECVYEPKQQPLALNLSTVSVAETPQLAMNILENTLELPFGARESQNFVSITMEDASDSKVYSCADLRCTYSIKNEKLKFEFNTDITIKKGKLKIDRGADAKKTSIVDSSSHRNSRLLQELANYPIVIDGVSLMKQSRLSTAAFATRVIVGIFRLPLSLLVFWKFPHLAMTMDHMVTHLKVYSLMSQPYLAYVEVVFQSVSDSKILPFNFNNPFEHWNTNTLECEGFVGLRSKNMYCSFFDNYGENIIGIASVILTCVILVILSKKMLQNTNMTSSPRNFWGTIARYYGLHFVISKIDANHLEIALMTLIAYATADHSSKSVIGIIFGTVMLITFGFIARHVTNAARRAYQSTAPAAAQTNSAPKSSTEQALNQTESESDIALDNEIATFVLSESTTPSNKWSVYFFAARYIRALLLVIFVATVRDPVDQIVLVVILESVYLVALLLLEFRGSKFERFFHIGMHGVILAHLICRAIATSKTLSVDALQSSLATAIVVFLMIYVFAHVVACIYVLIGIFLKNSNKQNSSPVNASSTKIEMTEAPKPQEAYKELPIPQEPVKAHNPSSPISYIDMPVAPEMLADGRGPSIHNGNQASMQQNPYQSPISYMEVPIPPEMNGTVRDKSAQNGRDALVERNTNRPQPSLVDIDIPQE